MSAPAYVGLADAYSMLGAYAMRPPREAHSKAELLAAQALAIDSTLARAHAIMGQVEMRMRYDWPLAERHFRRAIALDPNNAETHQFFGMLLVYLGRTDEGFAELQRALELDPLAPGSIIYMGLCRYMNRQYEEAEERQRRALKLDSTNATSRTFLAMTLSEQGLLAEAIAEYEKAAEFGSRHTFILSLAAITYGRIGERDSAAAMLEELMERSEHGEYVAPDLIAFVHIGLGQHGEAIDWLERAYEEREQGLVYLKMAPFYDPLRSHPRFQDLLRRMNFPE